ncbi:MAG: cytochrome C oxidase subunit IV family protein [Methylocystis sp.]
MSARFARLVLAWVALLILLAAEFAAAAFPLSPSLRPLLLVVALAMAGVIVVFFMEVAHGPNAIRLFAASGFLWLTILLALGSLDPLTRFTYLNDSNLKPHLNITRTNY